MPSSLTSSLHYMPGLDVVRGIAISMVLLYHGLAPHVWVFETYRTRSMLWLLEFLEFGGIGVHLFFVLSGFLITGILIDSRGTFDRFRNFYLRRALRIVPAYLVMIFLLRVTHQITWRYLLVCLLYFCNMSTLFGVGHQYGSFWSLSVEEQFYLVWPVTVFKVSRRHLAVLCASLIVLVPALRFALLYGPPVLHDIDFKTWAVADFFAAGAALAIAARSDRLRPQLHRAVAPILITGTILLVILLLAGDPVRVPLSNMIRALELEPWVFLFTGLVLMSILRPAVGSGFVTRCLIFLANISYGLYLCHQAIFYLVDGHWPLQPHSRIGLFPQLLLRFLSEAALSRSRGGRLTLYRGAVFLRLKPGHERSPRRPRPRGKNHVN